MRHRALPITFLGLILLALPVTLSAQKLQAGTWPGTVTPPGEGIVNVTFDVKTTGDSIAITLKAGEHGEFVLNEIKVTDEQLTFSFAPGPVVNCTLDKKEDGSYAGTCKDSEGGDATMTMIPPKPGSEPFAARSSALRHRLFVRPAM